MENQLNGEYSDQYSEDSFWSKLKKYAKSAGIKVVYAALLLFYTLQNPATPKWIKATIIGALGYFISPIDAIPDMIPVAGFTDDFGALTLALVTSAIYVNDEVKEKARKKLRDWFGDFSENDLAEVDGKINK